MKNQSIIQAAWRAAGAFLAGAAVIAAVPSVSAKPAPAEVLSPSTPQYGYSYSEWVAKFWQWSFSQATNNIEKTGPSGVCTGPASGVRFLNAVDIPQTTGGLGFTTNKITLFAGTPLFFPIISVYDDNTACPLSAFTSLTGAELEDTNESLWTGVTSTTCTIDDVAVTGLDDPATSEYLTVSPPFSYTTAAKHNVLAGYFGETCIPGDLTVYPCVAQGIFLMLSPLPPGKHTIHTVGIVGPLESPYVEENNTYIIDVLP